jgi:MFS transporter, ACS family, allantoate permease
VLPWQILFIFTGVFTVTLGAIFLWAVPDNQLKATWLSENDRILAIARIRENQQGVGNKTWKNYQFIEVFKDPLVGALLFYSLTSNIPNGGITNFFSQLIVSFGYTPVESLLLGTPAGAVQVVSLLLSGYYGDKSGSRLRISLIGLGICILGVILLIALPDSAPAGKLVGYYMTLAGTTPFVMLLSLISSNIAGYTKKTTVAAMFLIFYCVGNIIGKDMLLLLCSD